MFSDKQLALRDYLIQRLGFQNQEFLEKYLESLGYSSRYYKNYRAIYPDEGEEIDEDNPPKDYFSFDGEKWVPDRYTIIDYLIDEYALKKGGKATLVNKDENNENLISATDLSTYSFCPVSYSISKSLVVEVTTSAERGTSLHEESRLINRKIRRKDELEGDEEEYDYNTKQLVNDENRELFEDIKNSRLIYSGHEENEKKYFINSKGNFVGQPDYVFEKPNGKKFIVEEKFKREKWDVQQLFFHNHQIQLYSYIYGLDEFDADYGYLVYWYYDASYGDYNVTDCKIKRLSKSKKARYYLNQVFSSLTKFKSSNEVDFNPRILKPNKCANCVVNRYCGHKTGRFEKLKYPYSLEYHKTWYAAYPEILKKEEPKSNDENALHSGSQINPTISDDNFQTSKNNSNQRGGYKNLTPQEQKDILNKLKW